MSLTFFQNIKRSKLSETQQIFNKVWYGQFTLLLKFTLEMLNIRSLVNKNWNKPETNLRFVMATSLLTSSFNTLKGLTKALLLALMLDLTSFLDKSKAFVSPFSNISNTTKGLTSLRYVWSEMWVRCQVRFLSSLSSRDLANDFSHNKTLFYFLLKK